MNCPSRAFLPRQIGNPTESTFGSMLLLMMTLFFGLSAQTYASTVHRWYSPTGTGDGSSKSSPTVFDYKKFATWTQWSVPVAATNIVLHFLPGTHSNVRIQVGTGNRPYRNGVADPDWNINKMNVYIQGGNPDATSPSNPEETVLVYPDNCNEGSSESGHGGAGMINVQDGSHATGLFADVGGGRLYQARRVVVENLVLDCNWRNQKAFTSLGSPSTYKMYGINVIAATGRFRNVIVRDLGSHGLICASQFDSRAGVEAFPLMAQAVDDGQEPVVDCNSCDLQLIPYANYSDPRPWLIEGCEVHGFNNIWGGYNTAIMVNVVTHDPTRTEEATYINHHPPAAFLRDKDRRFALVRNCQVRGGAYAFGQAGPGYCIGSTFTGNAVVGSAGGYNADTHAVLSGDITNSAILDVHVGVRQITDGHGSPDSINYHTVAGNLLRISSRETYRRYQDYKVISVSGATPSTTFVSDASLVLGYNFTNTVSCFHISGITLGPVFRDNWITTRAVDGFYKPNPAEHSSAVFRPIWWQTPTEVFPPYESGAFVRLDAQNVSLSQNRVSALADNFVDLGPTLGDAAYSSFSDTSQPAYTLNRSALNGDPEFQVASRTERVVLFHDESESVTYSWKRLLPTGTTTTVTDTRIEPRLTRVREVQIQKPWRYSSDFMKVNVRLVDHWLPSSGGPVGSEIVQEENVALRVVGPGVDQTLGQVTGEVAQFTLPIPSGASGSYSITAWWLEPGQTDYSYHGSYSTAQHVEGTVVTVSVSPDVANDRNTALVAQRPVFTVRRSGPTTEPLTVNLELPSYNVPRFKSSEELVSPTPDVAGTYGTGTGQDYVLKRGTTTITPGALPNRAFTVTIAAGDTFTNLTLYPTYDDLTENEVAYLRVASGTGYAIGLESTALAFIYDGPEFVVKELTDPLAYYGSSTATAINGDASPAIAGSIYIYSGGYSGYRGGRWAYPNLQGYFWDMRSTDYPGYTPEPLGVADTLVGQTWFVGSRWSGSKRVPWRGWPNSITDLGTLKSGGSGEALAIANHAVDGRRIVGWSEKLFNGSTYRRPVVWLGANTTPTDLGSLTSGGNESVEGAALAVNSLGNVGGWSKKVVLSSFPIRGFLVTEKRAYIDGLLDERLPVNDASEDKPNSHSIVYSLRDENDACGVSYIRNIVELRSTNAVVWRNSLVPTKLRAPLATGLNLVHSDALAFAGPRFDGYPTRVIGRVWTNNVNTCVAVMWNTDSEMAIHLADSHFTGGATGWVLRRPRGVSSRGWIVGEGLYNGSIRGFVMVRR
jgi:hypothetical protein